MVGIVNFQNNGLTSTTLDVLHSCSNERPLNYSSRNYHEEDNTKNNLTLKMLYPDAWLHRMEPDETNSDECQSVLWKVKFLSKSYTIPFFITPMNREEFMKHNFPYARYNYSSNLKYQECVALETEILPQIDRFIIAFRQVEEILMNLTTSDIQESFNLIRRLLSYYDEIINIGLIYHKYGNKLKNACPWMNEYHWLLVLSKLKLKPEELRNDMKTSLDEIRNAYVTLDHNYATFIRPNLEILGRYLDGNITKV